MMPIGPLMIEHRLIEHVIKLMKEELLREEKVREVNSHFIEKVTDFIRAYADQCHHGKEEKILFRELEKKNISTEHRHTLEELKDDHRKGRELTGRLVVSNEKYLKGEKDKLPEIMDCIKTLVEFYPGHIEKEDKQFFMPVMGYFTSDEKAAMLKEGYEFDSNLLHTEYQNVVSEMEDAVS